MKVKEENAKVSSKLNIQKSKIIVSGPITLWQIDGEIVETVSDFIFLGSKITADGDWSQEIKRCLLLGKKVMTNLDSIYKKQRHYFVNKGPSSQGCGFSCGHVWMWELDCKESWVWKNWCFWTVVLEKTLENPLNTKDIQPVHPKGNQSWIFIGRTDVEAETPILCPLDAKNRLICKDPDAGKDWRWEEKGLTEDDGWMASPTQWAWVWVNSRSWWWTGRPGMLQSMESQRVGHDWATGLNWTDTNFLIEISIVLTGTSILWLILLLLSIPWLLPIGLTEVHLVLEHIDFSPIFLTWILLILSWIPNLRPR